MFSGVVTTVPSRPRSNMIPRTRPRRCWYSPTGNGRLSDGISLPPVPGQWRTIVMTVHPSNRQGSAKTPRYLEGQLPVVIDQTPDGEVGVVPVFVIAKSPASQQDPGRCPI